MIKRNFLSTLLIRWNPFKGLSNGTQEAQVPILSDCLCLDIHPVATAECQGKSQWGVGTVCRWGFILDGKGPKEKKAWEDIPYTHLHWRWIYPGRNHRTLKRHLSNLVQTTELKEEERASGNHEAEAGTSSVLEKWVRTAEHWPQQEICLPQEAFPGTSASHRSPPLGKPPITITFCNSYFHPSQKSWLLF